MVSGVVALGLGFSVGVGVSVLFVAGVAGSVSVGTFLGSVGVILGAVGFTLLEGLALGAGELLVPPFWPDWALVSAVFEEGW